MGQRLVAHTYRVRLAGDGSREPREIEFEAYEPHAALTLVKDYSNRRLGELFEDGHRLASIRYVDGFWEIA